MKIVFLNNDETLDVRDFTFREEGAEPSDWFYFKPINALMLAENDRQSSILLPAGIFERRNSPMTDNAGEMAVVNHYPDLRTVPDVIMEEIQHSPDSDVPCYKEIRQKNEIQLTVADSAVHGMNVVLKYFLTSGNPPNIRIGIDDDVMRIRPVTKQGLITLPIMSSGKHQLLVESASLEDKFFLRVDPAVQMDARACIGRSVYQLDGNGKLTVPFRKPDWESCGVNIALYTEQIDSSIAIQVEMDNFEGMVPGRSAKHLTIPKRKFVVTDCGDSGSVFLTSGDNLARTKTLYFPVHDDLPPGGIPVNVDN